MIVVAPITPALPFSLCVRRLSIRKVTQHSSQQRFEQSQVISEHLTNDTGIDGRHEQPVGGQTGRFSIEDGYWYGLTSCLFHEPAQLNATAPEPRPREGHRSDLQRQ